MNILRVVSNERSRFIITETGNGVVVTGTGIVEPRYFPNEGEATEFAMDQQLIIELEFQLEVS